MDIKKLGRIPDGGGHRFLGRAAGIRVKKSAKPGMAYIHHAMDDHSRLVYSEILAGPHLLVTRTPMTRRSTRVGV